MAVLPTRPFQNQSYSIAAASAFGNSFYAPAYLSSSPASRRSLETRKKLPPETTPAFATLRTSSIIRSPPFRHSLFLNTPAFHRFSLRTESSLTKLRRNAFSLFSPYRISHEWKIASRKEVLLLPSSYRAQCDFLPDRNRIKGLVWKEEPIPFQRANRR